MSAVANVTTATGTPSHSSQPPSGAARVGSGGAASGVRAHLMAKRSIPLSTALQVVAHRHEPASAALHAVARQFEAPIIDTSFEDEETYRQSLTYVREFFGWSPANTSSPEPRQTTAKTKDPTLAALIGGIEQWVRETVRAEIGHPSPDDWIDQHESPLGHRRHLDLVRRGTLPGRKDGKRVIVRRADIKAYQDGLPPRAPAPKGSASKAIERTVDDDLRDLGFGIEEPKP
jgi:hypothetical protein